MDRMFVYIKIRCQIFRCIGPLVVTAGQRISAIFIKESGYFLEPCQFLFLSFLETAGIVHIDLTAALGREGLTALDSCLWKLRPAPNSSFPSQLSILLDSHSNRECPSSS